tara:strand:+ start:221 stop:3925 length:3705 start_codon:yes stop_codon:yes gene_type:complete
MAHKFIIDDTSGALYKDFTGRRVTTAAELLQAERGLTPTFEIYSINVATDTGAVTGQTLTNGNLSVAIGLAGKAPEKGLVKASFTASGTTYESASLEIENINGNAIESAFNNSIQPIYDAGGLTVDELGEGKWLLTMKKVGAITGSPSLNVESSDPPSAVEVNSVRTGDSDTKAQWIINLIQSPVANIATGSWSSATSGSYSGLSSTISLNTTAMLSAIARGQRDFEISIVHSGQVLHRSSVSIHESLDPTAAGSIVVTSPTLFTLGSNAVNQTETIALGGGLAYDGTTLDMDGVTAGTASASMAVVLDANKDISGLRNVVIDGTVQVNGETTLINSTVVTIDDPIFTLGGDGAGVNDSKDRGIEFKYNDGSAKVGFFGYDDSASAYTFLTDGTNNSEVFSGTLAAVNTGALTVDGGRLTLTSGTGEAIKVTNSDIVNFDFSTVRADQFRASSNSNQLEFRGGTNQTSFLNSDGGTELLALTNAGQLLHSSGSAAAPSISFSDSDTGLFSVAADQLGISTGGTERVHIYNDGLDFNNLSVSFKDSGGTGRASLGIPSQHFAINVYGTSGWINNALNIDNDTGMVGISTATPTANLDITTSLNQQHLYIQGALDSGSTALARLKTISNGNVLLLESGTTSDSREIFDVKNSNGSVFKVDGVGDSHIKSGQKLHLYSGSCYLKYDRWQAHSGSPVTIDNPGTGGLELQTVGTTRFAIDNAGAATFSGAVTIGANTDGHDVKFFANDTGKYMLWDESENALILPDHVQFRVGSGYDLRMYHTGDSYLRNYTGSLNIENEATDQDIIFRASDGSSTELLRLDGSESTIAIPDDINMSFGDGGDYHIKSDAGEMFFRHYNLNVHHKHYTDNRDFIWYTTTGGTTSEVLRLDGSTSSIAIPNDVQLRLGGGNDIRLFSESATNRIDFYNHNTEIRSLTNDTDITFSTTTGDSTSELLRLDGSASSVNASGIVNIEAPASGFGEQLRLTRGSGGVYYSFGLDNDKLNICYNATSSATSGIVFDGSTSRLGIGTASPRGTTTIQSALDCSSDFDTHNKYALNLHNLADDTDESIGISFGLSTSATAVGAAIAHERKGSGSYGDLYFLTQPSGGGVTERMRITSAGLCGIGTDSPLRLLHLKNDSATVTNNSQLRIENDGAGDAYIQMQAGSDWSFGIDNSVSDRFNFSTSNDVSDGNEAFILHRSGDIETPTVSKGIILKSPNGTRYRLHINDDASVAVTAM